MFTRRSKSSCNIKSNRPQCAFPTLSLLFASAATRFPESALPGPRSSLPLLPCDLIPERISTNSSILPESILHRRTGQASQSLITLPSSPVRIIIAVLASADWADVEIDIGVLVPAAEHATGAAAGVASVPAHDVSELDAAGLAVPEAAAYNEEDDGAKYGGEGDIERLPLRDGTGPVLRGEVLLQNDGQGDLSLVLCLRAANRGHESDGQVGDAYLPLLIVLAGGLEREVAPDRWDAVVRVVNVIELAPFLSSGVVPVEAEGDLEGPVVVLGLEKGGCVVEVGVPRHFSGWLAELLDEGHQWKKAHQSRSDQCKEHCSRLGCRTEHSCPRD